MALAMVNIFLNYYRNKIAMSKLFFLKNLKNQLLGIKKVITFYLNVKMFLFLNI
jgi:hypothetical protein